MKIEELNSRIKELNDYFVRQIIEGNYQVIKKESIYIIIEINDYSFTFWFGYGEDHFRCVEIEASHPNYMYLQFDDKEIKKTVRSILMSEIVETREEEIKRLEAKLKTLKSTKE